MNKSIAAIVAATASSGLLLFLIEAAPRIGNR